VRRAAIDEWRWWNGVHVGDARESDAERTP